MIFNFSVLDGKCSFLGKFSQKKQNCLIKTKLVAWNSDMLNWMVLFICPILG